MAQEQCLYFLLLAHVLLQYFEKIYDSDVALERCKTLLSGNHIIRNKEYLAPETISIRADGRMRLG